jgi:hypothetical protein
MQFALYFCCGSKARYVHCSKVHAQCRCYSLYDSHCLRACASGAPPVMLRLPDTATRPYPREIVLFE